MDTKILDEEMATYEAHKDELLASAEGKFVLIKGTQIIDAYQEENDAIGEGYRRFGNVPFLVKQIERFETPICFVSGLLAV